MAEINETSIVPPGRLTQGVGYRKIFSVGPCDVACGSTARHGWGAAFSGFTILPSQKRNLGYFFFARERVFFWACASFVHVIWVRTIRKTARKVYFHVGNWQNSALM